MKGRVLIVDDDRNLRVTLAEILQSCHFEVLEAENSAQALPMIGEQHPDLVFCDWKMPGGGGDELLRALQEREHIQRLPVIVMTAYGNSGNAIKAIQLGAYDFISKPFDLDEISATARRALEHARLQKEVESLRDRLREAPSRGGSGHCRHVTSHARSLQRHRTGRSNRHGGSGPRRVRDWQGTGRSFDP